MADQHLDKAIEVMKKMKPGNYDAISALALISIAESLTSIAESLKAFRGREPAPQDRAGP